MAAPEDATTPAIWGTQPHYGEFEIVGARERKPRMLGEGSFGKTYEAVRTDTVAGGVIEEHVAIKVINPELLSSDSRRRQFMQELVALTKFKHSNLIHYIRCGEQAGEVYYAMQLCRGGDLMSLVRRFGPLPEKVVALIGLQIASGLREVHQRHRLVHRDVKPANIMLADELEAGLSLAHLALRFEEQDSLCRIVDFGLVNFALEMRGEGQRFAGSPMYASPEQIGEQSVDGRSDIYSLGMTLWYLLQGKGPLLGAEGGNLKGVREVMARHLLPAPHDAPVFARLSEHFRPILLKMLAKQPDERFASAAELQAALRLCLSREAVQEAGKFGVTRLEEPLESVFRLEENRPTHPGLPGFMARHRTTGEQVQLTVMADLSAPAAASAAESTSRRLCDSAELSVMDGLPDGLLQVREVVWATDRLAYTEETFPQVALADLLKARETAGAPPAFAEMTGVLGPVAEALDFMLRHGREKVLLRCEGVWLTGRALVPDDPATLTKPLTEWDGLRSCFSMMGGTEPHGQERNAEGSWAEQTVSGSVQMTDDGLHPAAALAHLIYRIFSGAAAPAAAQFTPNAYVVTRALRAASNQLLRDVICGQRDWAHVTAIFQELCTHEGVEWRPAARHGTTSAGARSRPGSGTSRHPTGGSSQPALGSASATGRARSTTGDGEKICEVVSPGVIRSPHDTEGREQQVRPEQWVPWGRVTCAATGKILRLPRKLGPLAARVVAPGVIHSPHAPADVTQQVPWDEWLAGSEVVCAESGRRITLPPELPLAEALLPAQGSGFVISPYDQRTTVPVPPESWQPGVAMRCPVTQLAFFLPAQLPPLEAHADAARPGQLASPYAPGATWRIDPPGWMAGRDVTCPATGRPLRLPSVVGDWTAEATSVDAARRAVGNPFRPGTLAPVPPADWRAGAQISCPETGRKIVLPADLPPLPGEPVENQPGAVRSPYSGATVSVEPKDWRPGVALTCPATQLRFLLPDALPEWLVTAPLTGLPPGTVQSPYDAAARLAVPAAEWLPRQVLTCPATGRRFQLPADLPMLTGTVKAARAGMVASPFTAKWQSVSLDEWRPGGTIACAATRRPFLLPAELEEWLVNGQWVPGRPGWIRSPFPPHPELEITAADWKPRQLLTCPATGRRFRAPIHGAFPSLDLEKAVLQMTLAEPQADDDAVAAALKKKYPAAHTTQVRSVWERHHLETPEMRLRTRETGELLPAEPGRVRSPYGARPVVMVPPVLWVVVGAATHCPETGRSFLLPADRPPLRALLTPGDPGLIASPFHPETPFRLAPDAWKPGQMLDCPKTRLPFQLPPDLPEWLPQGTVKDTQPGVAFSPFGRCQPVPIPGTDWHPGAKATCLETGRAFSLPAKLPPLTAKLLARQPGRVLSPYAKNCRVRVPERQWKPGAAVTCPATKLPFLLPADLPAMPRRTLPVRRLAFAALAVLLAGVGLFLLQREKNPLAAVPPEPAAATPKPAIATPVAVVPSVPKKPLRASRVAFAGGLEIEDWPAPRGLPSGLRLVFAGQEIPLTKEENQLVAVLPPAAAGPAGATAELQLPGWKPLPVALAAKTPAEDSTDYLIRDRKRLERQRFAMPLEIPPPGTDYDAVSARYVRPLPGQAADTPPIAQNPIRVRLTKDELRRGVPAGVYDLTLLSDSADKAKVPAFPWKTGVTVSREAAELESFTLPPTLAGEYLGLVFTTMRDGQRVGYLFAITLTPKLSSASALVNGLKVKEGQRISASEITAKNDELGTLTNLRLTAPGTVEFDCPLTMFNFHWVLKAEAAGSKFMYGRLLPLKYENIEQDKAQLEQVFRRKARDSNAPLRLADVLKSMTPQRYREIYDEYTREAKTTAASLTKTYPEMTVPGASFYFSLHPKDEPAQIIRLGSGEWDFRKAER